MVLVQFDGLVKWHWNSAFFRIKIFMMRSGFCVKTELTKLWNEVFSKGTPEYDEVLGQLRVKYRVPEQK